jgi:hypothetical protein
VRDRRHIPDQPELAGDLTEETMSLSGIIIFVLAGFAVLFLGSMFVLDLLAHICKKVRVIRNVPVTWSGREYRRSPSPVAPVARVAVAPTAAQDDIELVARVIGNPTASIPFNEHKRMLELGFARYNGQWMKQ